MSKAALAKHKEEKEERKSLLKIQRTTSSLASDSDLYSKPFKGNNAMGTPSFVQGSGSLNNTPNGNYVALTRDELRPFIEQVL